MKSMFDHLSTARQFNRLEVPTDSERAAADAALKGAAVIFVRLEGALRESLDLLAVLAAQASDLTLQHRAAAVIGRGKEQLQLARGEDADGMPTETYGS